jgi:TolB protein
VDFTALAERYGWRRIPAITRSGFDWRSNWTAIEYWHYERRDGLRWFDAISQIYDEETLAAELDPAVLRERNVRSFGSSRLGFPPGWPGR